MLLQTFQECSDILPNGEKAGEKGKHSSPLAKFIRVRRKILKIIRLLVDEIGSCILNISKVTVLMVFIYTFQFGSIENCLLVLL